MNKLPKHHGAEPSEARGPMQLHRLHRLKAGPEPVRVRSNLLSCITTRSIVETGIYTCVHAQYVLM